MADYDELGQDIEDYELTARRNEFEAEQDYHEAEFDNQDYRMDADNDDVGTGPPKAPPPEPLTAFQLFAEDNRDNGMTHAQLKTMFKENLGLGEKQQYKRRAKDELERFEDLCARYKKAHPEWNPDNYYDQLHQKHKVAKSRRTGNRSGGGAGRGRKRANDEYMLQDLSADSGPPAKKRRTNSQYESGSKVDRAFREIRSGGFGGRRKKKDGMDLMPEAQVNVLKAFLDRMRDVARDDRDAKLRGQPALGCMRELDKFVSECSKRELQGNFLESCNLLDVFRDWLCPFPDGSLPHLKIRTELYRVIEGLRLHTRFDELKNFFACSADHGKDEGKDGFAKTMMKLWQHPDETPQNKTKLQMLIQSWVRVLSQTSINYNEVFDHGEMNKKQIQKRSQITRLSQQRRRSLYDNPNAPRKRARVPQAVGFDFAIAPTSSLPPEFEDGAGGGGGDTRRGGDAQGTDRRTARNNMLNKPLRSRAKGARLNGPSLTGRG